MPKPETENFQETTVDGPRTKRWVLEAKDCQEMKTHRIARLGLEEAFSPYQRVRLAPAGSFFLATTEGEGRILLDGKWQRITAGSLFMAPPRVLNAFYAVTARKWAFAWIRYEEPNFVRPMVGADSPVRAASAGAQLATCVEGLRSEFDSIRDPKLMHHWISLIQELAKRAAQPIPSDDRLAALWARVGADLAHPWDLVSLAREAKGSPEYLRRKCQQELGRSPMQQVTYMRMQQAQTMLETSQDKLDVIAAAIGFTDGMTFSRAFKRWVGVNPSEYRQRH